MLKVNAELPPLCVDMCLGGDGAIYITSCYENAIFRGVPGSFGEPLNMVLFVKGLNNPNSIEYDPVLNGLLLTEIGEAKV